MQTKTSMMSTNKDVSVLEKYIQVIPSELLNALQDSAYENGLSLDMEIAARLIACLSEPELNKENSLFQKILAKEFNIKEATAECKRKREAALYLYEVEKLRLFLRFEKSLPRQIKEGFMIIDVKEETKRIKADSKKEGEAE